MKTIKYYLALLCMMIAVVFSLAGCSSSVASTSISNGSSHTATTWHGESLDVYTLDIGQGDAHLIKIGDEYTLIDTGDVDHREAIVKQLKALHVNRLKNVIITHPHADHLGGFYAIAKAIPIKNVYDNGFEAKSTVYKTYRKELNKMGITPKALRKGDIVTLGDGAVFEVYAPWDTELTDKKGKADLNNNSIVGKLVAGKFSMLFTGDAEKEEEARLIKEENTKLSSRVLKVGHHGSKTSSSKDFIRSVRPEIAVISCGLHNDYGHPHKESLQRLLNDGKAVSPTKSITIYRTDTMGQIHIHTNGDSWSVTTER